jgi:arsenical pump membrane protein
LSNDATAVVLTPAVLAAAAAARVADPLPYALICAFVANAASFILPISNPANLVVFGGGRMPALMDWLARFSAPSIAAVAVTYLALYLTQRGALRADTLARDVTAKRLGGGGRLAGLGVIATALLLIGASALGRDLGAPTAIAGVVTALAACVHRREGPWALAKQISWGVLPLVAGLFVLVEALEATGVVARLAEELRRVSAQAPVASAWGAGALLGVASNLLNNLPAGLIAAATAHSAQASKQITGAMLIGVDLGPNLSITGSLATILWLHALRREGIEIGAGRFLKLGVAVMTPALLAALAALMCF